MLRISLSLRLLRLPLPLKTEKMNQVLLQMKTEKKIRFVKFFIFGHPTLSSDTLNITDQLKSIPCMDGYMIEWEAIHDLLTVRKK